MEVVKNVLNCLSNRRYFFEILRDVLNPSGGYEVDGVSGIATWGDASKHDLSEVYGFSPFNGIRFFYDHDWAAGVQESEIKDVSATDIESLLIEAVSWNRRKFSTDVCSSYVVELLSDYINGEK